MPAGVSRAVIEVLLDRVHQGAATLSPEGQLTYANQRLATMLGRTRAQLIGKPLAELAAEADCPALADALATGRDTASQCRVAFRRANGGGELHTLLVFAPLGHGQTSCLVTDLSPGKNAVGLAHEVRNVLGAIRNSVEVLKRSPPEGDAARAIHSLERQCGRILELLNTRE